MHTKRSQSDIERRFGQIVVAGLLNGIQRITCHLILYDIRLHRFRPSALLSFRPSAPHCHVERRETSFTLFLPHCHSFFLSHCHSDRAKRVEKSVCYARHRRRNIRSPTTTAQALRRARPPRALLFTDDRGVLGMTKEHFIRKPHH